MRNLQRKQTALFNLKDKNKAPTLTSNGITSEAAIPIQKNKTFFLKQHLSLLCIVFVFIGINLISGSFVGFSFWQAILDFPAGFLWFVTQFMPTVSSFEKLNVILPALASTVFVSIAASCTAAILAYICAVLGSQTVGVGGVVPIIIRAIASVFRNIPIVAWAFLLLFSFKQSEFTGFLALFLQSFGFLTRCFLENIDELSIGPIEALRASGATYLQVVTQAVIPMSITQVVSWVLYMIETNIRSATLVGMLTGTGIGFVFDLYYKSFRYDCAGLVLVCIIVVVIICETLSNYVRRRVQ